jgi:uncharacterized protein YggE
MHQHTAALTNIILDTRCRKSVLVNPNNRRGELMSRYRRFPFPLLLSVMLLPLTNATAQLSGSRGGVAHGVNPTSPSQGLPALDPEVAQGYIMIDGRAELRIKPTEIRVVLAVTAEGESPAQCRRLVSETIKKLTTAWQQAGMNQQDIVEDFISVLPRYEFEIEKIRNQEVAVEKKVGYLMQTNVHLAVKDDAGAMRAINLAFEHGVSDIIAFDYWSKELDQLKIKARAEAVTAARQKSDALLGTLFENKPPIINLQESTKVYYPESLYESFTNSSAAEYQTSYSRRDLPQIRMFRPRNTYYRGLYLDGDVQAKELPMRSEISVVSTVRLYFQSPVAKEYLSAKKQSD